MTEFTVRRMRCAVCGMGAAEYRLRTVNDSGWRLSVDEMRANARHYIATAMIEHLVTHV